MKKILQSIAILIIIISFSNLYSNDNHSKTEIASTPIILQQVALDANNINSWILNTGIFDQDRRTPNTPGFEWPKGSGSDAIFTCGLTIAALYNGSLRMASAMYSGEYVPGYVADSLGIPVGRTSSIFKIYSVKRHDSYTSNPDWLNWGLMVPYGAPYVDVNHNGNMNRQLIHRE